MKITRNILITKCDFLKRSRLTKKAFPEVAPYFLYSMKINAVRCKTSLQNMKVSKRLKIKNNFESFSET